MAHGADKHARASQVVSRNTPVAVAEVLPQRRGRAAADESGQGLLFELINLHERGTVQSHEA